jgi:3-deoxy-alpha-D-manno-octulosonate 8-oxidase
MFTGPGSTKMVGTLFFGDNSLEKLEDILSLKRNDGGIVFFVDHYFEANPNPLLKYLKPQDHSFFVDSSEEPTTEQVDALTEKLRSKKIGALVGFGGGSTLDVTKAVANLLTNPGKAEDYQGWNLVKNPAVYKIGIPTISGTGAEASRTSVMVNKKKNLKLGMNSVHSVYDFLLLDPTLSKTVPREQYFYTAMDTYIHCIESLAGRYRHALADSYSREALVLVREIMFSDDMMSDENRSKLMVASYLGGSSIGNSFVGVVHPISAGLSTVLGTHHCEANCLVMQHMQEYYPRETEEFFSMMDRQKITLRKGLCNDLSADQRNALYGSSIIHEVPLKNALGDNFKNVLTKEKMLEIYSHI